MKGWSEVKTMSCFFVNRVSMVGLNIHKSKYCKEEEKMEVGMVESQDSDPEWEMAKSTDEHQKRLHFTKEEWAMSVEGRHQRQNVENVKLDVMPSL